MVSAVGVQLVSIEPVPKLENSAMGFLKNNINISTNGVLLF